LPRTEDILSAVADYYTAKLRAHGPTARGVDWKNTESQVQRHRQFLRLLGSDRNASILDLGCGYGDFLPFLRDQGFSGPYVGYDIATAMVEAARTLHGEGPDRLWRLGAIPRDRAAYAIASGILNVKVGLSAEDWRGYVLDTIGALAQASERGFAFNVLTRSGDPALRRPDLYYADPAEMLAYCIGRFGPAVAVLQDYGLWEFTVIVRHPGG
jgi:SAM-dependent methyltransferase